MIDTEKLPTEAQEEWLIAEHLIKQVTNKCSGESETECCYNKPSDVYFIGNLRPSPSNDGGFSREMLLKLAPSAFGAEFKLRINKDSASANIKLLWSCYYRVFPTLEEQKLWMAYRQRTIEKPEVGKVKTVKEEDSLSDLTLKSSYIEREQERRSSEELFVKYKKINGEANGRIKLINRNNTWIKDASELQEALDQEIARIVTKINDDPNRIRESSTRGKIRVTNEELRSEKTYRTFIDGHITQVKHEWAWNCCLNIIEWNTGTQNLHILIQFVNVSKDDTRNQNFEPFLFNPTAEFEFVDGTVVPFELELASQSFRFDRELLGKGFNCGVRCLNDKEQEIDKYITTHTPIYRQSRYKTKEQPEAVFKDLANNPETVLTNIVRTMEEAVADWHIQEAEYKKLFLDWGEKYHEQYESDTNCFKNEIARFNTGLELIKTDSDIRLAFQLTNRTFERAGHHLNPEKAKTKWRLFQIVFLVTQVPGIAALSPKYKEYLDEREMVDIVYFPTGGGKTEAYLAALIMNAFYDRIRGKKAGVTSWIRFPLRLLTVQQTQRLSDIIGNAELVRAEYVQKNDKLKGTPFTVGYYVGGSSTPNELSETPQWNEINWSIAIDDDARQQWKRVFSCPSCRSNNVRVEFNEEKIKLLHICQEKDCKFPDGIIPLYVIDEEIYRYLPTVIVGTIDKLANIGLKRHLTMVFGKVDGYCKKHGYFNGDCTRFECKDENDLVRKEIPGLTGPSLFIQDELHLLKEGLGTFDAHYETFAQHLLKEHSSESPLKIIASSATIEEYKRQVRHLYGRSESRMFPGPGPLLQESFYAQTFKYPQRLFVGILPHNKTIFNTILEIVEAYHESIHNLKSLNNTDTNPCGGNYNCGSNAWNNLVDKYRTSLTYFLAGRELDSVKTDIEHYINPKFAVNNVNPVVVKELTGGTSTDDVTSTLELLGEVHDISDPDETVLATSMISHGVDVDRLNCMIFYGMPRLNAEYIQSSSRVGRKHVGIVFNCLHPIRERDQSHFAYFEKYHEFLGQLVEPVAINRWSTYSVDRTLPGLFMAVLLQILSNEGEARGRWKYDRLDYIGKMFSKGELDENRIVDILKQGYQVDLSREPKDALFNDKVEEVVVKYIDRIRRGSTTHKKIQKVLSPAPMTSLRDVDENIIIEMDSDGTDWIRRKRGTDG